MPEKNSQKKNNGYYFEADIKVREGDYTAYKGKVRFIWRSQQAASSQTKLKTRSRKNNTAGYIFAETYVVGRCPDRYVVCVIRKPQDVLDKSVVFHFQLRHKQAHATAIGKWQISGMEASLWTALISRKFKNPRKRRKRRASRK